MSNVITYRAVKAAAQPLYNFSYDFVIPSAPALAGRNSQVLRLKVVSCDGLPGFSSDAQDSLLQGIPVSYPGMGKTPGQYQVTYEEAGDAIIHRSLRSWWDLQWDIETGQQRPIMEIKADAYVSLLNSMKKPVATCMLMGCYVLDVPNVALDGTSALVKVPATFKYDTWKYVTLPPN